MSLLSVFSIVLLWISNNFNMRQVLKKVYIYILNALIPDITPIDINQIFSSENKSLNSCDSADNFISMLL